MKEVTGVYANAQIFTEVVENSAVEQIQTLCNQPFVEDCKIRIMPDVHTGASCVIGFTADLGAMVIPNIGGVDIGCGMLTVGLGKGKPDFAALDEIIRTYVPSGKQVHEGRLMRWPQLQQMHCFRSLRDTRRLEKSIGTLGGGNHFIEVDVDEEGNYYLVVHTGSRNLGKQVAEYYQKLAEDIAIGKDKIFEKKNALIAEYKATGRRSEIQAGLKAIECSFEEAQSPIPKELCYLSGEYRTMYLEDMRLCQQYAQLNRATIVGIILAHLYDKGLDDFEHFETVHNYIDHDSNIVRKGAVSARVGEKLLIPINMRDGSLLCIGKGNADWNYSAPHGAGRLFSRTVAKANFTVEEYRNQMEGIYTTSVNDATLDECPMAYKTMADIVDNITPTAQIQCVIKPVYNFKAGE